MKISRAKKYPSRVIVKDEIYKITLKRHIDGGATAGDCDDEEKKIRMATGQARIYLFRTFIHECLHALDAEYGIKLKHSQIYALEEALADFILQNF